MPAAPSPSIVPALDENRPQIGPNLAGNPDFCKTVMAYLHREYVYPQVIQQQPKLEIWRRIDDAFRVRGAADDLDISAVDPQTRVVNPDAKGRGGLADRHDGYSSRVYPATFHKQIVTKTDMHMSIAWADGLPVRAVAPRTPYEHPLYNPTQQSVDGANRLLEDCAREIRLKKEDRKGRGSAAKYGHAWAAVDWEYELEDRPIIHQFPADPQLANAMLQDLSQQLGPPTQVDQQNMVAVWVQRGVKTMRTNYRIQRVDDVFIDQTMPADDMDKQLCPCVRTRGNRGELHGNDYDPDTNPFGYLNCQEALQETNPQWQVSQCDTLYQQELQKKGLSLTGQIKPANAIKQRWTMYPMLAIDPQTGDLDDGSGIDCPSCQGKGTVPGQDGQSGTCPQCQGRNRIFLKPERYVVEAFGNMEFSNSAATCLRIQIIPNPNKRVPLLFTANLTEDTAGAIPLCKAEASLKAVDQEATSVNQWFDSKNGQINPPWIIPEDADKRMDCNRPNGNIQTDNPNGFVPMRTSLDPTQNMVEFMSRMKTEVMDINGMSPGLLGEVSSGRRAATEIQNAFDAGKMPITIEIDQYGEDMLAGWAQFHLDNIEAFADREWIRKQTGRTTFGKVQLFSAVADEFLKRQAAIGNFQYLAQMVAPIPGANIQPIFAAMCNLMRLPINPNEVLPDGGVKKAIQDGLRIVTTILGKGQFLPPNPADPHQIFIEIFEQALQDEHWQEQTPETLPLLQQRLMMQMQLLQQQQQAQLMAQQHQLMLAHAGASLGQHFRPQMQKDGQSTGNQPAMSNSPAATSGGVNQQTMGGIQS